MSFGPSASRSSHSARGGRHRERVVVAAGLEAAEDDVAQPRRPRAGAAPARSRQASARRVSTW